MNMCIFQNVEQFSYYCADWPLSECIFTLRIITFVSIYLCLLLVEVALIVENYLTYCLAVKSSASHSRGPASAKRLQNLNLESNK